MKCVQFHKIIKNGKLMTVPLQLIAFLGGKKYNLNFVALLVAIHTFHTNVQMYLPLRSYICSYNSLFIILNCVRNTPNNALGHN